MSKIIAVIIAAALALSVCVVPASADDYSTADIDYSGAEYIRDTLAIMSSLVSGDVTVSEAYNAQCYLTEKLESSTVSTAQDQFSDLIDSLTPYKSETELQGVAPRDYANNVTSAARQKLHEKGGRVNQTQINENLIDMHGGSVAYKTPSYYGYAIYFGTRGVLYPGSPPIHCRIYGQFLRIEYNSNGTIRSETPYSDPPDLHHSFQLYPEMVLYGDWRWDDDSPATDQTQPTTQQTFTFDTDTLTDEQLIRLLQDMINQLKFDFPDLSTIEGLLSAILSQCQSINGKLDGPSDGGSGDYSDIQIYIDTAIASLATNQNDNTQAIVDELIKLRGAVEGLNKDIEYNENGDPIDPETGENLKDVIQSAIDFIATLLGSALGSALGNIPSIADVSELGSVGVKSLVAFVDLLVSLEQLVPISVISGFMTTMQATMANDSPPDDLTFSINSSDDILSCMNGSYTVLSSSWFDNKGFVDALTILRSLIAFFLIYRWLKWAREFMANMI